MRLKILGAALLGALAVAAQAPLAAFADLSFGTKATWRMLNVPLDHQVHGLDCEAASLQMALAYAGISAARTTS